jgi:putative nucleotidyltransferase with HDIG domain
MTRQEALTILHTLTKSESLLRHARSVELVMEQYAQKLGEDPEEWATAGLLHDADYEMHPEQHPAVVVELLRDMGENKIAHAISAHYTKWGAPDELTGFIIACSQVRPDRIEGLEVKSVLKKLGQKSFAASVDREEVYQGADLLGVNLEEHIAFIISVLQTHKEELRLGRQI